MRHKMARTLDEILKDRNVVTQEQADRIEQNALAEAEKYWGGKRANAGRKAKIADSPRNKQIKVSDGVKIAIQYAYDNGIVISLDDIKLLKYAKETGITLDKLQQA